MVQTKNYPDKKYYGADTKLSIYGPKVSRGQQSFALMGLGNGRESVEVGWVVCAFYYMFIV